MSPTWTRRRSPTPPDSGRPFARLAAALAALLLVAASSPACGKSKNENRIKPIMANLSIAAFPGTNSAVFLEKKSTTGDLVTVNVNLHTSSTINFDAFTLEFDYDPLLVQVSDVFEVNPALLGDCCLLNRRDTCTPIQPQCVVNSDANSRGVFLLGVAAVPGGQTASVSADTILVTLGFVAATTIDPPGTRIKLISGAGHGDCEILQYGVPPAPAITDLLIPCLDLNATMTAAR